MRPKNPRCSLSLFSSPRLSLFSFKPVIHQFGIRAYGFSTMFLHSGRSSVPKLTELERDCLPLDIVYGVEKPKTQVSTLELSNIKLSAKSVCPFSHL